MSVFRPRHADGVARLGGANLAPVYALLRIGRAADVYCGKMTRSINKILCTGQPGFTSLLKVQILPNAGLLRRLRRETSVFPKLCEYRDRRNGFGAAGSGDMQDPLRLCVKSAFSMNA